jgi:hypothetical protein
MTPRILPDGRKLCAKCGDVLGGERCAKLRGTCAICGETLTEETDPSPAPEGWGTEGWTE